MSNKLQDKVSPDTFEKIATLDMADLNKTIREKKKAANILLQELDLLRRIRRIRQSQLRRKKP